MVGNFYLEFFQNQVYLKFNLIRVKHLFDLSLPSMTNDTQWKTINDYDNIYISLFLNKPLQYIGIENYKTIYKYVHVQLQLQRNRNGHRD
jgi:hypothetical protein